MLMRCVCVFGVFTNTVCKYNELPMGGCTDMRVLRLLVHVFWVFVTVVVKQQDDFANRVQS